MSYIWLQFYLNRLSGASISASQEPASVPADTGKSIGLLGLLPRSSPHRQRAHAGRTRDAKHEPRASSRSVSNIGRLGFSAKAMDARLPSPSFSCCLQILFNNHWPRREIGPAGRVKVPSDVMREHYSGLNISYLHTPFGEEHQSFRIVRHWRLVSYSPTGGKSDLLFIYF
jgi:hypothetical protein